MQGHLNKSRHTLLNTKATTFIPPGYQCSAELPLRSCQFCQMSLAGSTPSVKSFPAQGHQTSCDLKSCTSQDPSEHSVLSTFAARLPCSSNCKACSAMHAYKAMHALKRQTR